jgi:hypothetical protein
MTDIRIKDGSQEKRGKAATDMKSRALTGWCDTFARSGKSPCFHFEPLGLSRRTAKSCVALCLFFVLCSMFFFYSICPSSFLMSSFLF